MPDEFFAQMAYVRKLGLVEGLHYRVLTVDGKRGVYFSQAGLALLPILDDAIDRRRAIRFADWYREVSKGLPPFPPRTGR